MDRAGCSIRGRDGARPSKKLHQLLARGFGRDDPKDGAGLPDGFMLEEAFDVFEPGNARDALAGEEFPEQDHEPAVGDRQLGAEQGAAVIFVAAQRDHGRRGRRDEQPAAAGDLLDRFTRGPAEEFDAEDGVERRQRRK